MDDAHLVRHGDGCERLHDDVADVRVGDRPVLVDHAVEVAPLHVLHRDVEEAVRLLAEVDDAYRVRVVEPAGGLRLAMEAADEVRVDGDRAVHHLHGDVLLERSEARLVHGAHRAAAEEFLDLVLAGDGPPDHRGVAARTFRLAAHGLAHRLARRAVGVLVPLTHRPGVYRTPGGHRHQCSLVV